MNGGPYPLVVFAHGYAVTPGLYARLLRAWTRAGYVVAAPVFPYENANAPGGPRRSDLPNQPRDIRFVISRVLARNAAAQGYLSGLVDARYIGVSGHSDGGVTALAAGFDPRQRDPRISAGVILSGALIGTSARATGPHPPALLAVHGTGDTTNPLSATAHYYGEARRPKFFLRLFGAEHLPPYTHQQPQLGIIERVSTAFLDRYLKGKRIAAGRLRKLANVRGVSALSAQP
jgi:dienelactone hydrolase